MLEDIIKERKNKLNNLIESGVDPYPAKIKRTVLIGEILKDFNKLSRSQKDFFIVGRVMALRDQGNLMFADVRDGSGKIQAILKKDLLKKDFEILKKDLDIGDFVSVAGGLLETKSREKSVEAKEAGIIAKALRPLPTEWFGLKDAEERFRKRYLDIILNDEVKEKILKRSEIVKYLRDELDKNGFIEVETPMLQTIPGGAKARPFATHHNALDVDFYLRIAPELYLKRLLIAGFEKVFEIGRNFRNEGIDAEHNPEFTMLELYWAYEDCNGLMEFAEELLKKFIPGKWEKVKFVDVFKKISGKSYDSVSPDVLDNIFKKEVRPKIMKPTLITDYPETLMALAKTHPDNPKLTESFQLIVDGTEIIKGFSEMNNPLIQREQMERQEKAFRAGDEESSRLDSDFLEALEYGMPPAAGLGLGIDRLISIITKNPVKEIIIFPTLRPK